MTGRWFSFLQTGFRPFYLGAAVFAALAVPAWIRAYSSGWHPAAGLAPMHWHAHEMIFGFVPAVMVGFLFTAVRNWTGRMTPAGGALAAVFALWIAARLANWLNAGVSAVALDAAFLLSSTLAIAVPIWQARNRRNAFVVVLLLGLTALCTAHGLAIRGWFAGISPATATTLALDLALLLMVVIGGRVIPAFSANAIVGLKPRISPALEWMAIGIVLAILAADAVMPERVPGWLFYAAAAVHLLRLAGWQPWKTRRNLLLLALPLAYLWIPIHLLLRALEPALAIHALALGAMANLMLAMMTRSALGHTGRPLVAGSAELICFTSLHLAAGSRVIAPLLFPEGYLYWMWAAAAGWCLGFTTFAIAYWPILTRPRLAP